MTTLPTINALGTTWWIEIFDEMTPEKMQSVHDGLHLFISAFDKKYSRFNPDSVISTLNASRKLTNPDQETIDLLNYGVMLYHDTNAVFNFLIGEQLVNHGYDALYSFTPKDESVDIPDPTEALMISNKQIILTLGHIDLGGYGKGYLIDLIAARLTDEYAIKEFLINGGGDMYATSELGKPVIIYLEHPTTPGTYIAQTTLFNEGFAASSTNKRRWEHAGHIYNHIVDTTTGKSAANSAGIFVKAPQARVADAWSTTLLLSAPDNHIQKLSEQSIKAALFETGNNTLHFYNGF